MSRKIDKSDWQRRRRSPRISAIDAAACKGKQEQRQIKRKFDHHHHHAAFNSVSKLAKQVWKGKESPRDADDHSVVEWRSSQQMLKQNHNHAMIPNAKTSRLPAKDILELVLDTLQRRDSYEIFAEPVDPDEVEDYYEIIKEPMDFGTMRAKLHEGMYHKLEQFERDVFLIPENAMHFNSSATIYFRQARAIHDLAKRVFDALKTDPENFVSEFSGTRRRSMRKALSNTNEHTPSTSTFRRNNKKNPAACAGTIPSHFYATNILTGGRDDRLSGSPRVAQDRRLTYWSSSLGSISSKPLVLMNLGDISYEDSLMAYVKDLGPIAQMVAKRKLQKSESGITPPAAAASSFRTFRDFAPGGNPFREANSNGKTTEDCGKESPPAVTTTPKAAVNSCSSSRRQKSNNSSSNWEPRPVILALENFHSHTNVADFKMRSKKIKPHTPTTASTSLPHQPLISRFAFDLPFLKARLNEMNKGGEFLNKREEPNCTSTTDSVGVGIKHFLYNQSTQPCKSLDSKFALHL